MITDDQFERIAIHWFHDTCWNHVNGAVMAPGCVAVKWEDGENIKHRTPNIERRGEERRRVAESLRRVASHRYIALCLYLSELATLI